MKPIRVVLGLGGAALFCAGIIATYNDSQPQSSRIGPGWFQDVSMYGGTALLLLSVVAAIASAQIGAGWRTLARPSG